MRSFPCHWPTLTGTRCLHILIKCPRFLHLWQTCSQKGQVAPVCPEFPQWKQLPFSSPHPWVFLRVTWFTSPSLRVPPSISQRFLSAVSILWASWIAFMKVSSDSPTASSVCLHLLHPKPTYLSQFCPMSHHNCKILLASTTRPRSDLLSLLLWTGVKSEALYHFSRLWTVILWEDFNQLFEGLIYWFNKCYQAP